MTTLTYGTVTGRFDDTFPGETVAISGTVTFVAEADYLLSPDTTPKATLLPTPKTVALVDNAFTVDLIGTDNASLNPLDWTYRVYFQLAANNAAIKREPISIAVPSGVTTDLADATPVAASEGNAIVRGPQGEVGPIGLTGPQGIQGVQGIQGLVGPASTVPGPQGIQGIQGIQGVKGDPGAWSYGTDVGSADLNTFTVPGMYRVSNGGYVTALNNYPVVGIIGTLTIMSAYNDGLTRLEQVYTPIVNSPTTGGNVTYRRQYYNGTWTPWHSFNATRVDQTAGRVIYQWDNLNSREQLIYGDTGIRNVYQDQAWLDALFNTGAVLNSSNFLRVRRVGSVVELMYAMDKAGSGSVTAVAGFPLGFRPQSPWNGLGITSGLGMVRAYHPGSTSALIHQSQAMQLNVSVSLTYTTTDPWPATLPGTAVGTIPNL